MVLLAIPGVFGGDGMEWFLWSWLGAVMLFSLLLITFGRGAVVVVFFGRFNCHHGMLIPCCFGSPISARLFFVYVL